MLRKRSRPVTGSSSSKNSAADHQVHHHGENNTNFLLPTTLSQLPPPPSPSPSPPDKKSIKLLPTSLFFFNSSKLFSNLFFTTTADSNSIAETEKPPPPQQTDIMNHPPSSRFDAHQTFFPPPPTSHLGSGGGANSSVLTDKQQQQKLNPTRISSSVTTTKQQHHHHHHHFWEKSNPERGVGLVALIDETLNYNNHHNYYNDANSPPYSSAASTKQQKTKLVVFGSQLKIQIPPSLPQFLPSNPSPTSSSSCCNSPGEFGIKTPRSNLFTNSRNGPQQQNHLVDDGLVRTPESISIEEIELSEDYTCVITHGPNPKTTRIFGNCILESCCGGGGNEMGSGFCSKRNEDAEGFSNWSEKIPEEEKKMEVESFLSFCHHCKKKIGEGNDIYMYRGEKAFCSQECRCQGMLFEEVEA